MEELFDRVRKDFPILNRQFHGKPFTYLDSAATSQKPMQVIDAVDRFFSKQNANVHRAIYALGEESTREYEGAREKIAKFINAKSEKEIVFTRGTTEGINMVSYGWGLKGSLEKGDEILSTVMEHHSNHVPWHFVQDMKGAKLKWVDINDDGTLKMEQYDELITDKTRLVAVTHCSNVLGTINDVREIAKRAHEVGALCLVDAAQSVPHFPVDVQELGCDFFAFSGHKMLGPTGVGVLFGRQELLEEMEPMIGGGEMIREVELGSATWNDVPHKFEGGTPNMAGVVGLGAAVDYLEDVGMDRVRQHEREITQYALDTIEKMPGVRAFGTSDLDIRGGVVSFEIEGVHPHDVASILDVEGIAVRSGHHCAQPLMNRLDVPATSRASFYVYNGTEDVDRLAEGIRKVQKVFA
jgi:cysteine desulfurase/selenocysteine lyase